MTLATDSVVNYYTGDGSTSEYDYTYKIFSATDLVVTVTDDSDSDDELTYPTDYTVDGVGLDDGGTVTLLDGYLTDGYTLSIKRVRPLTQETDLKNNGSYYPVAHENALDHITMCLQQMAEEAGRCLKISRFDAGFDAELPAGGADNPERSIIINAAGDGLDWGPTGSELAAAAGYADSATAAAAAAALSESAAAAYATAAEGYAGSAESYASDCEEIYGSLLSSVGEVRTANYACSATGEIVRCDPSGGGFTVTLPDASTGSGVRFIIKNVTSSTNEIKVSRGLTETDYEIDGLSSRSITSAYGSMELVGNGSGWMVIQ